MSPTQMPAPIPSKTLVLISILVANPSPINSIYKDSFNIFYDGFAKPFKLSNLQLQPNQLGKSSKSDRIEFIEGLVDFLLQHNLEKAIILQDDGQAQHWKSPAIQVALGLAFLTRVDRGVGKDGHKMEKKGPIQLELIVVGGPVGATESTSTETLVPGLLITTVPSIKDFLAIYPQPQPLAAAADQALDGDWRTTSNSNSSKRPPPAKTEPSAKRFKITFAKPKEADEDEAGEIVEEGNTSNTASPKSKLQKPYLIWPKYSPNSPASNYPENSFGSMLQVPNSINSRPDLHGRR